MPKQSKQPKQPKKTTYSPKQVRQWKAEMESKGDANSTYFYEDNDQ